VEIMRQKMEPTYRSWRVRVGEREYAVGWWPENAAGPTRWKVMVEAKARRSDKKHWREIRGQWIIREIRAFENNVPPRGQHDS
jgi:hypothetical protein